MRHKLMLGAYSTVLTVAVFAILALAQQTQLPDYYLLVVLGNVGPVAMLILVMGNLLLGKEIDEADTILMLLGFWLYAAFNGILFRMPGYHTGPLYMLTSLTSPIVLAFVVVALVTFINGLMRDGLKQASNKTGN